MSLTTTSASTDAVAEAVAAALTTADGALTVGELMQALRSSATTTRIPRTRIEAVLEADPRFARDSVAGRDRWTVDPDVTPPTARTGLAQAVTPDRPLDGLDLRDWQVEAFAAWAAAGFRGVVEAVTGTGKTRLGIAAARGALAHDGRVLVLVPTVDLMDQWATELRRLVPQARVGRLGAGHDDDLHACHVLVATPHSAAPVPVDLPHGAGPGLLVADEAHRYGAPTWGAALKVGFDMRLALTATYERNDDGLEEVLGPYFGGVVTRYTYDRAVPDGVVAPFRIAFTGTGLDDDERRRYGALDRQVRDLYRVLVEDHRLPRAPRRLLLEAAAFAGRTDGSAPQAVQERAAACRAYLSSLRARRDVAATCAGKLDVVGALAAGLRRHADRALVFTDTQAQAEGAARVLTRSGLTAAELHGDLPGRVRRGRLARFRRGELDVLVAPRVLDEGIDVPDADVALVLSSFRTRRQMLQRLGRILRLKTDGREARLVVAYAKDTREDPESGGHEDFLREVVDVALEVATFDLDDDVERDRAGGWLAVRR